MSGSCDPVGLQRKWVSSLREFNTIPHTAFAQHLRHMISHRQIADAQLLADLLVGQSLSQRLKDLRFAVCEVQFFSLCFLLGRSR